MFTIERQKSSNTEQAEKSPEQRAAELQGEIAMESGSVLSNPELSESDRQEVGEISQEAKETSLEMPDYPTTTIEVNGREMEILVTGKPLPRDIKGKFDTLAGIGYENLVAVRETEYHPIQDENGEWYIPCPYEATKDNSDPSKIEGRFTSHFALNHQVKENKNRPRINDGYMIIAPMKELVARNGEPTNVNPEDTFFRADRIYLPIGTTILDMKNGQAEANHEEVMKKMGFTPVKIDEDGIDNDVDKMISNFANENNISQREHTYTTDGAVESALYGLYRGNYSVLGDLKFILDRYDEEGLDFYRPKIIEGAKKFRAGLDRMGLDSTTILEQELIIDTFLNKVGAKSS